MYEVWTASLLPFHLTTMLAICWSASRSISFISAHQFIASVWGCILCVLALFICAPYSFLVAMDTIMNNAGCKYQ